ncbi:MAG TPA: helix-turn-helix domain-containing protein [Candidatus Angelobacter sp.]|nr:helix-turn-helix domain-containing protein [Candidatus Angelobacter sp.]
MNRMTSKRTKVDGGSLSDREFRAISKALSDPRRYQILRKIASTRECTCVELRATFPISAATMSHHLKELQSARLISIVREGKFAHPSFRREVWQSYLAKLTAL